MDTDDGDIGAESFPEYRLPATIAASELRAALCGLALFGSDPNFQNQAFNLALVDQFIMTLELELLRQQFREERTPIPETTFVSAQSQMWIFAAYELMRTWRQRAKDMIKWAKNGGLEAKLAYLRRKSPYVHVGREWRAAQIEQVLTVPSLVKTIEDDLRRTHIPFVRIEAIRISIAKHEIRGRPNSVPQMPTHGRINRWCGAIDFELEHEGVVLGTISRRDIADELRSLPGSDLPTDSEILQFDEFMRGPSSDFWDDLRQDGPQK